MTRDEPPPRNCELCNYDFEEEPEAELSAPALGSDRSKVIDATTRQLAQSLGQTNFRTGLREGDVAAVPVNNTVSRYVEQQRQMGVPSYQAGSVGELLASTRAQRGQSIDSLGGRPALKAIQQGKV